MTLQRLWAVLAVALPVLGALIATMSTVDLAYHLRAGAEILDGNGIPRVDTWTYTVAGLPWHDQQWGAQVFLAVTERLGGWTGLAVVRALLTGLTFGLVALAGVRQGASVRTASMLALAAFAVAAVSMALRPQLFAMVLFALSLLLVVERQRHSRLLWLAVPITLLWANLHGSFFLAPVLLGFAWLDDAVAGRGHRALVVATAAAVAATANPWGLDIWSYAFGLTTDAAVRSRITEWQPTSLGDVPGLLLYASGVAVALGIARFGRPSWPTLLLLAGFFALGVIAARGAAWWPLVAAVVVAGLEGVREGPAVTTVTRLPGGNGRVNVALVGALALAAIAALPVWRPIDPGLRVPAGLLTDAPSGITARLRELAGPNDRVFAPQEWGSWLEFAVPAAPVFLDSRVELFPEPVWRDHDVIRSATASSDAALSKWSVTIIIVASRDAHLATGLRDAGWQQIYVDEDGWLLKRPTR